MDNEKITFLKTQIVPSLSGLPATAKGKWGIMNAQQMVEHLAWAFSFASGKNKMTILNEGEKLQKFREFLMSEIPFKENTKNPLLSEQGEPLYNSDMQTAISKLQEEINYFFSVFEADPSLKTDNAFFGSLDYTMNIQLMHKHAMHHLKQFGLVD